MLQFKNKRLNPYKIKKPAMNLFKSRFLVLNNTFILRYLLLSEFG
jgi:hypothetical protein